PPRARRWSSSIAATSPPPARRSSDRGSMGGSFDFGGKTVLVTGASRGIGRGVAEAFAAARADLTILADDAGVETTAQEISKRSGRTVRALRCDITDRAAVAKALAQLDRI